MIKTRRIYSDLNFKNIYELLLINSDILHKYLNKLWCLNIDDIACHVL